MHTIFVYCILIKHLKHHWNYNLLSLLSHQFLDWTKADCSFLFHMKELIEYNAYDSFYLASILVVGRTTHVVDVIILIIKIINACFAQTPVLISKGK